MSAAPEANPVEPFGKRCLETIADRGSLCVGIDPHPELLEAWGLPRSGAGVWDFSMRVLDALGDLCGFFKPQSALFEEYGASGISALTATLRAIHDVGAISIADVKRGDIGSTMSAYARAYLSEGPLEADAMTLSPFLGFESLRPALDLAKQNGKGTFVLALTSNPESASIQSAMILNEGGTPEKSLAADIMQRAGEENRQAAQAGYWGHVGLVVGATVGERMHGLESLLDAANAPLLVPGFGAQGGNPESIAKVFGKAADRIIVSSSRGILRRGPEPGALQAAFEENLESLKSLIS